MLAVHEYYLVGPKMAATPDWTISHSFLLALKLSSAGYSPTWNGLVITRLIGQHKQLIDHQ